MAPECHFDKTDANALSNMIIARFGEGLNLVGKGKVASRVGVWSVNFVAVECSDDVTLQRRELASISTTLSSSRREWTSSRCQYRAALWHAQSDCTARRAMCTAPGNESVHSPAYHRRTLQRLQPVLCRPFTGLMVCKDDSGYITLVTKTAKIKKVIWHSSTCEVFLTIIFAVLLI